VLFRSETFTVGGGIVMATDNYSRKDVPGRFNKISMGAGARGFVTVRQYGLEATAGLTQIFMGGTKGMIADFSLSRPIMVNERLFLNPSIGTRWANAKHNGRFYGVSQQQSLASGLSPFRVGSGLLDAKAELGLQYRLTDHIGIGLMGGVNTLLGDVKDSPIVRKKTAPYGIGFLSYSF
jgi:outer membrane protein